MAPQELSPIPISVVAAVLVRSRRRQLGLSMREVSRRSGIPQANLSRLESGLSTANVSQLLALDPHLRPYSANSGQAGFTSLLAQVGELVEDLRLERIPVSLERVCAETLAEHSESWEDILGTVLALSDADRSRGLPTSSRDQVVDAVRFLLRCLRLRAGVTLAEAGASMTPPVPVSTLSEMETGPHRVSLGRLLQVADWLNDRGVIDGPAELLFLVAELTRRIQRADAPLQPKDLEAMVHRLLGEDRTA